MLNVRLATARTVTVGPILKSDGAYKDDEVVASILCSKNGADHGALDGSATLTHKACGYYRLALTVNDISALGVMELILNSTTNTMPVKALNVMSAAAWDSMYAASGGYLSADLQYAKGTALPAEGGAGQVAAAIGKFFDVATPTGTVDSLPDAVPGAAGGLAIAGSNAATTFAALTVTNATTLTGAVSLGSTLGVTGATTFTGAVTASNASNDIQVNVMEVLSVAVSESGTIDANVTQVSGDSTAADTLELFLEALDQSTGQIDAGTLHDDAITAASINTGALTADAFAADAIVAATLATGALTADAFAANAITNAAVADDVDVNVKTFTAGAITAAAFAADSIVAATLATGAITADAFAANAITNAAVADDVDVNAKSIGGQTVTATTGITMGAYVGNATAALTVNAFGHVTLANGAHGGATATLTLLTSTLGTVTATGGITADITGSLSGSVGSVTGTVGSVTGAVGSIGSGGITTASFAAGALNAAAVADDVVAKIYGTAITEAYGTDGSAMTGAQLAYLTLANVSEFALSGTTKTVKKLDGLTTAATYTLDSATTPTSITRAS